MLEKMQAPITRQQHVRELWEFGQLPEQTVINRFSNSHTRCDGTDEIACRWRGQRKCSQRRCGIFTIPPIASGIARDGAAHEMARERVSDLETPVSRSNCRVPMNSKTRQEEKRAEKEANEDHGH